MGKGLEFLVILQLLAYFSARLVSMALPMAILMASVMTMGNLAEHYELASLKSAGISLLRIMRPLIFSVLLLSIGAFFFANNVWPIANLKFRTLLYSITKQKPALNLIEHQFYTGIDDLAIRVSSKDDKTDELGDVLIYDHRGQRGNKTVIRAKSGNMKQTEDERYLVLRLYDGYSYDEQKETVKAKDKKHPSVYNSFKEQILRIDLSSLEFQKADEELFAHAYEMMTINQLDNTIDTIDYKIEKRKQDAIVYISKNTAYLRDSVKLLLNNANTLPLNDSLLLSFGANQQARIYNSAKKLARQQHDFIDNALKEVETKKNFKRRHLIEWHRKFFFAVASFVLFFIGAPLGAIIRKGGIAMPALTAFVLFIVYYVIMVIGEKMAKIGTIDVWLGMWLSTFVLFPVGVIMTWKAMNDSALMDKEAYSKFFKKLKKKLSKKNVSEA
ncbi:MAG: lipopolysaccharide export system permease protein [Litorivivens sp.]|jgi:lipopolysaccharide export system permease protein